MENTSRSITHSVQSGEYFTEARKWHMHTYLQIYTERFMMAVFALLALISAYIIVSVTLSGYWVERYPFPIFFDDSVNSYVQIKPLAKGMEPVNLSIARYLVGKYVGDRESYDPYQLNSDEWDAKLNRVRAMSTRSVYSNFQYSIDPNNPNSPIIQYKLQVKRDIVIKDVHLEVKDTIPLSATVIYEAKEIRDNGMTRSQWQASMDLSMTDLENTTDEKIKLQFVVTKYNVEQIQ